MKADFLQLESEQKFLKSLSGKPGPRRLHDRPAATRRRIYQGQSRRRDGAIDMTRADIDHGASAYVMVDKDFKPTGEPPPDPRGAYCVVCAKRIWGATTTTRRFRS